MPEITTDESGYVKVDQAADARKYLDRLERVGASPFWCTAREKMLASLDLRPGDRVLDVGCGTGDQVRAVAERVGPQGHAVGVDLSLSLLRHACQRDRACMLSLNYVQADCNQLPFPDASFDACRSERLLQHLYRPEQAVAEMARVLRSGARIAAIEPDYHSLTIRGAEPDLTRKVTDYRCSHFRCARIGSLLPRVFASCGLVKIKTQPLPQLVTSYDDGDTEPDRYARGAAASGVITEEERARWLTELKSASAAGRYRLSVFIFLVSAFKP